jgi:hypothetical protein
MHGKQKKDTLRNAEQLEKLKKKSILRQRSRLLFSILY